MKYQKIIMRQSENYTNAIELGYECYHSRGVVKYSMGLLKEAIEDYDKAEILILIMIKYIMIGELPNSI